MSASIIIGNVNGYCRSEDASAMADTCTSIIVSAFRVCGWFPDGNYGIAHCFKIIWIENAT